MPSLFTHQALKEKILNELKDKMKALIYEQVNSRIKLA